jgi:CubicO group peptidase (beta-lactamase class C family)
MQIPSAQIDPIFSAFDRPGSPGCVLGVIQDGQIRYQRGYGMADLERGVPLSPDSVFDIASTGKQFTAFIVLALAQEGKLDLDAPVRKYLPELQACCDPVSVRQLLNHTSGIRDYCTLMELAGMPVENYYPEEAIFDLIARQRGLCHAPGEEFLYTNSGYFLFNRMVERTSGRKLLDLIREWIFEPLGMTHSTFNDDFGRIVPRRALAYDPVETGGYLTNISFCGGFGDGPILTTVGDLCLWDQNFYHNRLCGGGQQIISQMQNPGLLNNGEVTSYGCGLEIGTNRGLQTVSHSGSWAGYRSQFIRFPEQHFSVIVLANLSSAGASTLALKVTEAYLAELYPEPVAEGILPLLPPEKATIQDEWTGFYQSNKTGRLLEVSIEAERLILNVEGDRIPLAPIDPFQFQRADRTNTDLTVIFDPEKTGYPPSCVLISDDEKPERFSKLPKPENLTEEALAAYCGDYYSSELDITYQIRLADGQLWVKPGYAQAECLRQGATDQFTGQQIDLRFERNIAGQPERFYLGAGRQRELEFIRQ